MVRQNRGGFPGGRPPAGAGMAAGAAVLLGAGFFVLQNSLFNVDGGHRAIKYRRISGVSKEIYTEGWFFFSFIPRPSRLVRRVSAEFSKYHHTYLAAA